jgi:hypothetical protein
MLWSMFLVQLGVSERKEQHGKLLLQGYWQTLAMMGKVMNNRGSDKRRAY